MASKRAPTTAVEDGTSLVRDMATTSPGPSSERPFSERQSFFRADADGFDVATRYTTFRSSLSLSPYADHDIYMDGDIRPSAEIRHTPSSLSWPLDTELLKLYTFISGWDGEEPHFKLAPQFTATSITPDTVYLDSANFQNGVYPCQYPSTCQSVFRRPADFKRHYEHIHTAPDQRKRYSCDHPKCERKDDMPFYRKDHLRDHFKEYHKEDCGSVAYKRKYKNGRHLEDPDWQKTQKAWLAERNISPDWWRCTKCLIRVYIKDNGWECPVSACKQPCETGRREARQQLHLNLFQEEDYQDYSSCSDCKWLENGDWAPCSSCQLPSSIPYYDDSLP